MKPYAQDRRDRIIKVLAAGTETPRVMAERVCVSSACVEQLWQRWRRRGSRTAKPHAGGRQRHLKAHLARLRTEVAKQPDAPLAEWRDRVAAAQGPRVSPATSCRALQHLKLPRKKRRFTPRRGTRNASTRAAPRSGRPSRPSMSTA